MNHWIDNELETLDFGDPRRKSRTFRILEDLIAHPTASIPQACGDWASTKATYRWAASEHIDVRGIRSALTDATVKRCAGQDRILVAQDTTSLDFTTRPSIRGLGPLEHRARRGMLSHTALALTANGVPQGILHQHVWARDEKTYGALTPRSARATSEKESQRWLDTVQVCGAVLPETTQAIVIGDREADIYDLVALKRPANIELLVRARHNRRVMVEPMEDDAQSDSVEAPARYVWESVRSSPLRGKMIVDVQRAAQNGNVRQPRQAKVEVRYQQLQLVPPAKVSEAARKRALKTGVGVPVTAILLEEHDAPRGATPLCWLLLSTLPITSDAQAQECVRWYQQRWKVERYHYALKSGCHVEELQLETQAGLERALALYNVVAWRLLWLTYVARETPDAPCTQALEPVEWKALWLTIHKGAKFPKEPPSLRQAVHWVARLGGFLGRKGDGEPGVKVIWRGLRRLQDITETFVLMNEVLGKG